MAKLAQLFMESNDKISSTRVGFLLWVVVVLAVWAYVSIRTMSMPAIPESVIVLLGILMTGKVTQKFAEKPKETPPAPPAGGTH